MLAIGPAVAVSLELGWSRGAPQNGDPRVRVSQDSTFAVCRKGWERRRSMGLIMQIAA